MGAHAKYSGSKIPRLIRCPGSEDFVQYLIQKGEIQAEETSTYADEGTMLHEAQELMVLGKPITQELDGEQYDCLDFNMNFLNQLIKTHKIDNVMTERLVTLDEYGIEGSGGTTDIEAFSRANDSLHILDWKFGQGVAVFVEKNEQLMTYLLGAARNPELLKKYNELWIHVSQPRFGYTGSYQCSIDELMGLKNAIVNAIASHDICAGEKQCLWCRGKVRCNEYNMLNQDRAATVFEIAKMMGNNECSFKKMTELLQYEAFFKKTFKAIKDEFKMLNPGQLREQNMKRVAGKSNRSYVSEEQTVEFICKTYEDVVDMYEDPKLKSPAQMEKAVKGLKKDKEWQELIYKPKGNPIIVSASDKRPDYDDGDASAASAFSHLAKK